MTKRVLKRCPWCGKTHWKAKQARKCYLRSKAKSVKWTEKEVK